MGITKTIDLSGRDFLDSGESRVVPLAYSKEYDAFEVDTRLAKTAACDEALEFASKIRPVEGKRFLLVSAVGDFESWGDNKKADAFPYNGLHGKHPADVPAEHFQKYAHKIPKVWGISCFPTKYDSQGNQIGGGNTFNEHINRFPGSFLGQPNHFLSRAANGDIRCGDILASFWNEKMRRCELIKEVWQSRLPHLVRAIDEGYRPGVSMACDIPCDRCSVCRHLAINEATYCIHLQRSNGLRGIVLPDGTPVVMLNDYPYFFDCSIVKSKAANEAGTIMKIASIYTFNVPEERKLLPAGERNNKAELLEYNKIQSMRMWEEPFSEKTANVLREVPLDRLTAYLGTMGIYPTCTDFANLMFGKTAEAAEAGKVAESLLLGVLANQVKLASSVKPEDVKVMLSDGKDFSLEEFQKVAGAVTNTVVLKSFIDPFVDTRPVHTKIDMSVPYSKLDDKAQAVLLAKIFTDADLHARVQELLVKPAIRWELEKLGLDAIYSSGKKNLPVYNTMATGYISGLEAHRLDKLYQK